MRALEVTRTPSASPPRCLQARRGCLPPRRLPASPRLVAAAAVSRSHRIRCRRLWRRYLMYLNGKDPTVRRLCAFILHAFRLMAASTVITYAEALRSTWWRRGGPDLRKDPLWCDFLNGLKRLIGRNKTRNAVPAQSVHLPSREPEPDAPTTAGGAAVSPPLSPLARWVLLFMAHTWSRVGDLADTVKEDVYVQGQFTVVRAYGAKEARRGRAPPRLAVQSSLLPSPLPPCNPASLLLTPEVANQILRYSRDRGLTGHSWRVGGIRQGAPDLDLATSQAKARHKTTEVHIRYLNNILTRDQKALGRIGFAGPTSMQ